LRWILPNCIIRNGFETPWNSKVYENFKNASTYLEIASKYGPYKENGKLWFYKGIAEYENKNLPDYNESLKKAATYDYYDIGILKKLLPEKPSPLIIEDKNDENLEKNKERDILINIVVKDEQEIEICIQVIGENNNRGSNKEKNGENLKNILILYYLKRYSDITSIYSKDSSCKNLDNLIKNYREEAYYFALSHYEFKDFITSFEIFDKLTEDNSDKNSKKFYPISWYYKGLILSELENGHNLGDIILTLSN
ncbi:hypothetical protein, partial [Methanosarcina sp.]|uniref:hypothetical protein n=1 Tax=Methanosarcina sp. TaxID=2213 RepID=UPI002ABA0712